MNVLVGGTPDPVDPPDTLDDPHRVPGQIESSLRQSRATDDYNDLDDTSKNPLLSNAGSNEREAFERYLLNQDLNEDFELESEDFDFAEEYFETPPAEREFLYTNAIDHERGPRPGVFGLAHLWFEEDDDAPLGRVRRAFYYKPFGGDVKERHVRTLKLTPDIEGTPISGETSRVFSNRDAIEELVDERLETIREGQVVGAFEQGSDQSKEQETLLSYLKQHLEYNHGEQVLSEPVDGDETVGERAATLRDRLREVKLKNTDEDRILRETFRHSDEYDSLMEWPPEEFLTELATFLDDHIEASTEYQETLVKESEVQARLICWGVIGT